MKEKYGGARTVGASFAALPDGQHLYIRSDVDVDTDRLCPPSVAHLFGYKKNTKTYIVRG